MRISSAVSIVVCEHAGIQVLYLSRFVLLSLVTHLNDSRRATVLLFLCSHNVGGLKPNSPMGMLGVVVVVNSPNSKTSRTQSTFTIVNMASYNAIDLHGLMFLPCIARDRSQLYFLHLEVLAM